MAGIEKSNQSVSSLIGSLEKSLGELRAAGRIDEALAGIEQAKTEVALQAFECHYMKQDYQGCAKALSGLGNSTKVLSRWIYLYAEAPEYRDEAALLRAAAELGYDSIHVVTCLAITARQQGSGISAEEVYKHADAILANRSLQYASIYDAHLLLSCGRLALAQKDYDRAIGFLDKADLAYPGGRYLLQHAEIHLVRADAFELKGDKWSALRAIEKAIISFNLRQFEARSSDTQAHAKLTEAISRWKDLEANMLEDLITPEARKALWG